MSVETAVGTINTCSLCGQPFNSRELIYEHQDKILGYPVVLHRAVERKTCECGHKVDFTPDVPGLMAAVAAYRILMPHKLNGLEIKKIRKATGLKGIELSDKLSVTPETISRWENDKEPIRVEAERGLRLKLLSILSARTHVFREDYEALISLEINPIRPIKWPEMHFHWVKVRDIDKRNVEPQWEPELPELLKAS
jgi:DNA-binding transcriptional regulator YiaG